MRLLHGRTGRALSGEQAGPPRLARELAALFARDLARWRQQVEAFPDTATLWAILPGVANAAGTLALHLEGNLREYVGRHLGKIPYERDREREFRTRDLAQAEIIRRLDGLCEVIPPVVRSLDATPLDADYPEPYDGCVLSTRQFLLHLYGHASYHLGQLDSLRRAVTGGSGSSVADAPGRAPRGRPKLQF